MSLLKKRSALKKISRKGKFMFLAYDQGLEHGPTDFNDDNVDPQYIIDIAKKGDFTGIIFQRGIAEQYINEIKKSGVPLIVKLNGKTNLLKDDPISPQLSTVQEAIDLGADAVGFTVYIGSEHEEEMMEEFVSMQRVAHENNLPVIAWIYPRGKALKGKKEGDLLAYAARVGLEIGADVVKVHSHGNKEHLGWAVEAAAKARMVIAGGSKKTEKAFLKEIGDAMSVGVSGVAVGRNIWQSKDPMKLSKELKKVIWGK